MLIIIACSHTVSYANSQDLVGVINLTNEDYTNSLVFLDGDITKLWPKGIPQDGDPITLINYPLIPVVIISYIYSGAVIICALICLVSTFAFRNKK